MPESDIEPSSAPPPVEHVGAYQVLGEIAGGGQGRVFRAWDPDLERDVAIKMLPPASGGHETRHARFLHEARAAGALNHPNVLVVHHVGTDGDRPYLVTELVDGRTLQDELAAGAMPIGRVLMLAAQIADGLAAAHRVPIVHRDLKPANVMVSGERAKIIDFGLAKATDAEGAPGAHTLTAPHTILGTAPYMSPEQARGRAVDFRSDLFSFGSLVYEMATGARAFERETPIETLTAIQHDEPVAMRERNPRVPARLQQIVARCMAKAPEARYASTTDLLHDLQDLRDGRVSSENDAPPPRAPWWRRRPAQAAAAAMVLAALGAAALAVAPATAGRDLERYRIVPLAGDDGYEGAPVWAPDGRAVAYIAERDGVLQVMARSLDSSRPVQVTRAVSDCRNIMWSADGSRVFFVSLAGSQDSLWSVSAAGGTAQMELRDVSAATLNADGSALVFLRDEGAFAMTLWVSSPVGAAPVRFAEQWQGSTSYGISTLHFTPDGTRLGLWVNDTTRDDARPDRPVFWIIDYPSGQARPALTTLGPLSRALPFSWMADGRHVVFGAEGLGPSPGMHLWIADTDTDALEALTVTSTSESEPAVSPDGRRVAFVADASHYDLVEIPLAGGPLVARRAAASDDSDPVWSPSGRQYAYVTNRSGAPEIWLSNDDGAVEVPVVSRRNFANDTSLLSRPAFSPDGQRLVYQRRDATGYALWASSIAGGAAVPVVPRVRAGYQDAPTWSPDSGWLAFTYIRNSPDGSMHRAWRLGKTRPGANGEITELRADVNFLSNPQWSPDGRWITVELQDGLYAVSPDGPAQQLISTEPWIVHTWARDSRSILAVRQTDDYRLQLAAIDLATRAERILVPDLGPVPPTTPPLRGFSLSPDGTRLLTSIARLRGDVHILDGFERAAGPWQRLTALFGVGVPPPTSP